MGVVWNVLQSSIVRNLSVGKYVLLPFNAHIPTARKTILNNCKFIVVGSFF